MILKENIQIQVSDIPDVELTTIGTIKRTKLQARRRITTFPYKVLHKEFQKLYNSRMSYGSFISLKPFYVSRPTEKEIEMCVCSKCLNPHCLYKAIKSAIDTCLPASLSQYLCKNMTCEWEPGADFQSRTCILGQCGKNCKIVNISADLKEALPKAKTRKVITMCLKLLKHMLQQKWEISYLFTNCTSKHDFVGNIIDQL